MATHRTLIDIYHRYPRIFAIMSTVHSDERMNAIQDTLTFITEFPMRDVLDGSPGQSDANELRQLLVNMIPPNDEQVRATIRARFF